MNVLDRLGLAIANAGYTWTPEMRQAYEEGIKELEAAVLAEREACAKVCEWLIGWNETERKAVEICAAAIRARSN